MSGFRGAADASLAALRGDLRQRAEVSASREVLELLPDTFHVLSKDLPFAENMETRIQSATLLLDESLGHCYINALEYRDVNAIKNCLCAYATVDNTSVAEELFHMTIVSPLIEKIIISTHAEMVGGEFSDDLERDYQQMIHCIEKDCKILLVLSTILWFTCFQFPGKFNTYGGAFCYSKGETWGILARKT